MGDLASRFAGCRGIFGSLARPPRSAPLAAAMRMPMMHVRVMLMRMHQRLMLVFMRMWLGTVPRERVSVAMVLVMAVPVVMHQVLMSVLMLMVFAEM